MSTLVRVRLGLAVCTDGPDAHGYYKLADGLEGRRHARHNTVVAAWRQVFLEAGGEVPVGNVERQLRRTHVPVPENSLLRIDLLVPGLNVARGLPLFCDVTVVSPITHQGQPRPATSNIGGRPLARAQSENDSTYRAVTDSGLGPLLCLGFEVLQVGRTVCRVAAASRQGDVERSAPTSASRNSTSLPKAMGRCCFG